MAATSETVVLGLGCNIGEQRETLKNAIRALEQEGIVTSLRLSSIYESEALLLPGSPLEWNLPFLNMAVSGITTLTPEALLSRIKMLEQQLGRKDRGRWGPREIDIDILAYGDQVVDTETLHIPHRELLNRAFALWPLAELIPDWRYPLAGPAHNKTARTLSEACASVTTKSMGNLQP